MVLFIERITFTDYVFIYILDIVEMAEDHKAYEVNNT